MVAMPASPAPPLQFSGKRILVTGATGSFGRATVHQLAAAGANITLNARDNAKLEKLAAEIPVAASIVAPFDLTDGDGITGWLRELAEKDGPFDGVAHMAGICTMRPLRSLNAEFIDRILLANTVSGIMLGKAFRQKICHTENASFVLVSSTSSFTLGGGSVAYAASKGAVTAAVKGMAHELLRDKIRVNCLVPAVVDSAMADHLRGNVAAETWQEVIAMQPLGLGAPDDIANAVLYLLSDQTGWMTGTAMVMDGGLSVA
jgi:NAD(P)-dependent dehydrogenase (short-subunit alcohol dehydrogenase family)